MPELPEVEVVRDGLARHVIGRTVNAVEVLHPRAVRRHAAGAQDLTGQLAGATMHAARRRGKYLWVELTEPPRAGDPAVVVHLGMSGQVLVQSGDAESPRHLRVRISFTDGGPQLWFADQRTFGGLSVHPMRAVGADLLPEPVAHIASDPMDPDFDIERVVARIRSRRTDLKRALLDQTVVSGIGNIYADEALWRARLHWARPTATLTRPAVRRVLAAATEVMGEALQQGGTSFDALYVNVNGNSGYFARSLHSYGRSGEPCERCGSLIVRERFMNRSSYYCPKCQRRPRTRT